MHGHPTIDDENEGAGGTTTIPFMTIISSQLGMSLIGPGHGMIKGRVTHFGVLVENVNYASIPPYQFVTMAKSAC